MMKDWMEYTVAALEWVYGARNFIRIFFVDVCVAISTGWMEAGEVRRREEKRGCRTAAGCRCKWERGEEGGAGLRSKCSESFSCVGKRAGPSPWELTKFDCLHIASGPNSYVRTSHLPQSFVAHGNF